MANKRELKKAVKLMCDELYAECVAVGLSRPQVDAQEINDVVATVMCVEADTVAKINHPEPGVSGRAYYGKLREALRQRIDEIVDQIYALA